MRSSVAHVWVSVVTAAALGTVSAANLDAKSLGGWNGTGSTVQTRTDRTTYTRASTSSSTTSRTSSSGSGYANYILQGLQADQPPEHVDTTLTSIRIATHTAIVTANSSSHALTASTGAALATGSAPASNKTSAATPASMTMGPGLANFGNTSFSTACPSSDTACYQTCTSLANSCRDEHSAWTTRSDDYQSSMVSRYLGGTPKSFVSLEAVTPSSATTYYSYKTSWLVSLSTTSGAGRQLPGSQGYETTLLTDSEGSVSTSVFYGTKTEPFTLTFSEAVAASDDTGVPFSTSGGSPVTHTYTKESKFPYPEPTPTCSFSRYLNCTFASECNKCTISGGTVQLLYFPTSTATPGQIAANTSSPAPTGVVTAVYKNFTMTSPTVYISFDKAYAQNECGTKVGKEYPGAILPINITDLSSVYGGYGTVYQSDPLNPFVTTPTLRAGPFTLADLNWPPPEAAYRNQLKYVMGREEFSIITWPYNPILEVPPQIRSMDPAWQSCGLDWEGLYDPPMPLQPVDTIAQPTMAAGISSPAAVPGSSVFHDGPSQTASPVPIVTSSDPQRSVSSSAQADPTESPEPQANDPEETQAADTSDGDNAPPSQSTNTIEVSSNNAGQDPTSATAIAESTTGGDTSTASPSQRPGGASGPASGSDPTLATDEPPTSTNEIGGDFTFDPTGTASGSDPTTTVDEVGSSQPAIGTDPSVSEHFTGASSGSSGTSVQKTSIATAHVTGSDPANTAASGATTSPSEQLPAASATSSTNPLDSLIAAAASAISAGQSTTSTPTTAMEPSTIVVHETVAPSSSVNDPKTGELSGSSARYGNSAVSASPASTIDHTIILHPQSTMAVVDGVSLSQGEATTKYQTFYSYGSEGINVGGSTITLGSSRVSEATDAPVISSALPTQESQNLAPSDDPAIAISSGISDPASSQHTPEMQTVAFTSDPSTTQLSKAILTAGTATITALQSATDVAVIDSSTISVGGQAASYSGVAVSLGSSGLILQSESTGEASASVVATDSEASSATAAGEVETLATFQQASASYTVVRAGSSGMEVVYSQTTIPVKSSAVTLAGATLSMASNGVVFAGADGTTTAQVSTATIAQLPPVATNATMSIAPSSAEASHSGTSRAASSTGIPMPSNVQSSGHKQAVAGRIIVLGVSGVAMLALISFQ